MVHEKLRTFIEGFRREAHPMAIMCGIVGALSAFYHNSLDINNEEHRRRTALRLIAKMPTLAAMSYKYARGEPFVYPRNDLDYAENFLHMMFATPCEDYEISPVIARAMDRILLLHADHEQNASTSTVRMAGSTGANPYACVAAGIAALWGPAHGGANEAVLNMLDEIGHERNLDKFVAKAKDRDDPFRLMGFGHRVYKSYDPRAKVMQQTCDEVLNELGVEDNPTLRMAQRLEKIALEDSYFVEKRLYPNVDFYSGIILKAIGIPVEMFTVIFATGRTPGWIAHWNEMIGGAYRLGRPRQLYQGHQRRDFVPVGTLLCRLPSRVWSFASRNTAPRASASGIHGCKSALIRPFERSISSNMAGCSPQSPVQRDGDSEFSLSRLPQTEAPGTGRVTNRFGIRDQSFSRVIRLEVSQRLPPLACTSA